ncbi:MAG: hypothetical protein HQL35_06770, partial [Alphaproteobacteria bacterium]|nr:hypothetical protein [Alphaproteobacteria bacterium]
MHHRRPDSMVKTRARLCVRTLLTAGVSLAALAAAEPAWSQDSPIVDINDPNISIDLSVLSDGGRTMPMAVPSMGGFAAPSASMQAGAPSGLYRAPGKDTPTSTLYVQPSSGFRLPPQTKSIDPVIIDMAQDEAPEAPAAPDMSIASEEPAAPPAR